MITCKPINTNYKLILDDQIKKKKSNSIEI